MARLVYTCRFGGLHLHGWTGEKKLVELTDGRMRVMVTHEEGRSPENNG
jgi:hypothetical protein